MSCFSTFFFISALLFLFHGVSFTALGGTVLLVVWAWHGIWTEFTRFSRRKKGTRWMRKGNGVSDFNRRQFTGCLKTSLPSTEQLLSLAGFTAVSHIRTSLYINGIRLSSALGY